MNKILLILVLLSTFFCQGQDSDKKKIVNLIKKSQALYDESDSYYLESDYKMYVDQKSNQIKESYKGLTIKKKGKAYTKIATTEFIALDEVFIKIDNETKRMKVGKPIGKNNLNKQFDVSSYIDYFSKYKLTEDKNQYICEMSSAKITMVPYSKVIMYISKTNLRMLRQDIYFLTKYKTKMINGKPHYDFPRLEIYHTVFKISNFDGESYFKKENYISSSKGKYLPSKNYKSYTIID